MVLRFLSGSNPGDDRHGTAADFEAERAGFEMAWRDYLPKRSESDFEESRQDAAWHATNMRDGIAKAVRSVYNLYWMARNRDRTAEGGRENGPAG